MHEPLAPDQVLAPFVLGPRTGDVCDTTATSDAPAFGGRFAPTTDPTCSEPASITETASPAPPESGAFGGTWLVAMELADSAFVGAQTLLDRARDAVASVVPVQVRSTGGISSQPKVGTGVMTSIWPFAALAHHASGSTGGWCTKGLWLMVAAAPGTSAQGLPPSPKDGGDEDDYWDAVIADAAESGETYLRLNDKGLTYVPSAIGSLTNLEEL